MLQNDIWHWKDGSTITSLPWSKPYDIPSTAKLLRQRNELSLSHNNYTYYTGVRVSRYNVPANYSLNYNAEGEGDNLLCSAFVMKPDFTEIVLSKINCKEKIQTAAICTKRETDPKVTRTHDFGYRLRKLNNSVVLTLNQICEGGFNIMYNDTDFNNGIDCLRIIPLEVKIDYTKCAKRASVLWEYKNIALDEVCRKDAQTNLALYEHLSKTCKKINRDASFFTKNLNISKRPGPHGLLRDIAEILSAIYPPRVIVLHGFFGGKSYAIPTDNPFLFQPYRQCKNHPLCAVYPVSELNVPQPNFVDPQFVVCSTPPQGAHIPSTPNTIQSFKCCDGSLIPTTLQCDGVKHCALGEDEHKCTQVCTLQNDQCFITCFQPTCFCGQFYYHCKEGGCVPFDKFCDGILHCIYGDDEHNCTVTSDAPKITRVFHALEYVDPRTGFCNGGYDLLACESLTECYEVLSVCQYDHMGGLLSQCRDGSHLAAGKCDNIVCSLGFKCFMLHCIPTWKICDGIIDCPSGEDEPPHCVNMSCPHHLRCSETRFCVPPWEICDGIVHCPHRDDEYFCQHCPQGCICKGNMMSCSHSQPHSITLINSPAALILNNSNQVFHYLYKYRKDKTHGIFYLSLDHGNFTSFQEYISEILATFSSLRFLHITNQQINNLAKICTNCVLLKTLNMSFNCIYFD